jgi:hypothetical protein
MERFGPCQEIEKKIDRMHVENIGIANMPQDRGRQGITFRAKIRNSNDFQPVYVFGTEQAFPFGRAKDTVKRDNSHLVTALALRPRKLHDDVFKSADRRMELPDDMDNAHINPIRSPICGFPGL